MSELRTPYEDWQPGEQRVRHNERMQRIERWEWSDKLRSWRLVAVFPSHPGPAR